MIIQLKKTLFMRIKECFRKIAIPKSGPHGFFVPIIVSFAVLLLIVLILVIANYVSNSEKIKSNIENYNMQMSSQMKTYVDGRIDRSVQKLNDICYDKNVSQFIMKRDFLNPDSILSARSIIDNINSAYITYDEFQNVFVYFKNTNVVLDKDGYYSPQTFFTQNMQGYGMDGQQWEDMLVSYKYYDFAVSDQPNQDVVIFKSIPLASEADTVAMVGVMLDGVKLSKELSAANLDSRMNMYIVDGASRIVSCSDYANTQNTGFLKKIVPKASGRYYANIGGTSCLVTYTASKYSDWSYVSVIPVNSIMGELNDYRVLNIAIVTMFLILSFVLVWYVKRQSYTPVKNLVSNLKTMYFSGENTCKNEFQVITDTIDRLSRETKEIQKNMTLQYSIIRNNMLISILKQMKAAKDVKEELNQFEISFDKENFIVLCIDLEEASEFEPLKISNDKVLLKTIMTNIAQDVFVPAGSVIPVEFDWNKIVIILNSDAEKSKFSELAHSCALEYVKLLKKMFSLIVTIGVSSCNAGVGTIGDLYQQAEEALTYKFLSGIGTVNRFKSSECSSGQYFYPVYIENKLINSIAVGDERQALEIIKSVFTANFKLKEQSVSYAKFLFFDMVSTVLKLLSEMQLDLSVIAGYQFNIEKELIDCKTIDNMHDALCKIIVMICQYVNSNKRSKSEELIQIITNYITENYCDENICITSIADAVNITQNYLSHYFKDKTGKSVMKYIEKLRIEKAKILLQNPDLTLEHIAEQIGFSNSAVLIRSFKKEEGVTPGQYRSAFQQPT